MALDYGAGPQGWENPMWTPGRLGINPAVADDKLQPEEAQVRVNLWQSRQGVLEVRPGLRQLGTGAGAVHVHSIQELNDLTVANNYTRFFGAGGGLFRGVNLAITQIDGGYSGAPLTLLPFRPRLTGASWMLVASEIKMRQVPFAGQPIALGLPAPAAALVPEVAEILTTRIASFDATDGTVAANWTGTAGYDRSETPVQAGVPTAADVPGLSGDAVEFTTAPGSAATEYASILGLAKVLDLTTLQGGAHPATEDDIIHFWIRCDRPDVLQEIRVYFVCSTGFDATVVPGTDAEINRDAFVKAIRPHDFTNFVELLEDALSGLTTARSNQVKTDYAGDQPGIPLPTAVPTMFESSAITTGDVTPSVTAGSSALPTLPSAQLDLGRGVWSELGNIGKPLRRSHFARIGNTADRGWDTITGIILVIATNAAEVVKVACDDWFLTGGYGLDSAEPDAEPYDWRYTHYHLDTGDESNPSPVMADGAKLECLRRRATMQPAAAGNSRVRQRFYRRGGSLVTDWFFEGQNAADGGLFTADQSDAAIEAAGTLEIDNDQPVSTIDASGNTVLGQPLPVLFGPIDGVLFGLGDILRPGHLYWSKPGRPGSWPAANVREICPPDEELLAGVMYGEGGIVLSRQKVYRVLPNLTGNGDIAVTEIADAPGIAQRWAWCEGPGGVYYVAKGRGIYVTGGGAARLVTAKLRPIFVGDVLEDYPPIDWSAGAATIFLECHRHVLRLTYTDRTATRRVLAIDLLTEEIWEEQYGRTPYRFHHDRGNDARPDALLLGGASTGTAYTLTREAATDDGVAIPFTVRTGYLDNGRPREDKLLGDVVADCDIPTGTTLYLQTRLNNKVIDNGSLPVAGLVGRRRYQFDPFGEVPQFARNVQLELRGTAPTTGAIPAIYLLGISHQPLPDQVMKRASAWETLGTTEAYVKGCAMVVDTGGEQIEMIVETTYGQTRNTAATLLVRSPGRRLLQFSWPALRAEQVRIRTIEGCKPWRLWKLDWDATPEPPRVAAWDTLDESAGDTYHTGVDLDVNTFNQAKQVIVWVDNVALTDPATGEAFFTLPAAAQRRIVHLSWTPGRGHIYRLTSRDTVEALLYGVKWYREAEPSEQANWNQNYTVAGTLGDKAVKGILVEADTFNVAKTVAVQVDGATVTTLTMTHNGRSVRHYAFPQAIGRVLRLLPTDANPGRLYTLQWIYDEEPLQLTRWETQELDHGIGGRQTLLEGEIVYRSSAAATLTVTVYGVEGVVAFTLTKALASTGGVKQKRHLLFDRNAGWLFKYVIASDDPTAGLHVYREETRMLVLGWDDEGGWQQPFGTDDLDKVRSLSRAADIAAVSGGNRA